MRCVYLYKRMTESATPQPAIPTHARIKKRRLRWGKSCTERMQIATAFHVGFCCGRAVSRLMMICYYSFDGLHLTLKFFSRESDPARSTIIISWDFAPITGQEITVKPRGAPDPCPWCCGLWQLSLQLLDMIVTLVTNTSWLYYCVQ